MQKKSWEIPRCDLCQSQDHKVLFSDLTYWEYSGVFQIVTCRNCELVFLSPRPPISEIAQYYEVDNYFGRDISDQKKVLDDKKERNTTFAPTYALIAQKIKKGSILDLGAGTGLFLSKYKDDGWDVHGVELTKDAVAYARSHYKISLRQGDFFQFKFIENSYDVVTLNGALEHLYNPLESLQRVRKVLKKNGFVVISVPNVEGFGRHIFGRDWFPWQPPRHLYHFSPKTMRMMLEKAGFRDIEIHHNYDLQNKYILFQSLRYAKSPKFEKKSKGGLVGKSVVAKSPSLKVQLGKLFGYAFSRSLAFFEPSFKKGEVLLVYAKK